LLKGKATLPKEVTMMLHARRMILALAAAIVAMSGGTSLMTIWTTETTTGYSATIQITNLGSQRYIDKSWRVR
jgi:type II secretory pathway component PulL